MNIHLFLFFSSIRNMPKEKEYNQTYFSDEWLVHKTTKNWVARVPSNITARCRLCKNGTKIIQLSNKGIGALKSHASGQGHKDKIKEQNEVQFFLAITSWVLFVVNHLKLKHLHLHQLLI